MALKGKFITFEGSESCGKSTHSRLLESYLREKGYRTVFLREPGGTVISERIRDMLLDRRNTGMTPETELLLYMASRAQTVARIILPALKKGQMVISDRFLDSTLVYQGYGLGMDMRLIRSLGKFVTTGIKPDLTVLLDLPLKKAFARITTAKDRIESRPLSYHKKVRSGYLELARLEPSRIKLVKLAEDKARTQEAIRNIVDKLLEGKR